jgi:adenine-specific DNA-methyltransferase
VLDPFAGSGTTGHAVLDLNMRLHASRSFVLVEQGNPATADAFARTLTAERLRRVITGEWVKGRNAPLPGSFTFECVDQWQDKSRWRADHGA